MHVLFLESQSKLSNYLGRVLTADAVSHFNIHSYDELDTYMKTKDLPEPDVIVLDQDYEFRVITRFLPIIKDHWKKASLLVLAERPESKERVRILQLGADDCMTKPIDVEELLIRINKLYDRSQKHKNDLGLSSLSGIQINQDLKDIMVHDQRLNLNHREYLIAETLFNHPKKVFSKIILLDIAWGIQAEVESNVVEVTISSIRKKLEKAHSNIQIKSKRHIGYWCEELK